MASVETAEQLVRIRRMGLQDLPGVVAAHLACFPRGFFARLGRRFVTRYYRTFLDGPIAVALVAELDSRVVGYLVGVLDPPQHRHLVLAYHGLGLMALGLVGLLRHPGLLAAFIKTRSRRYVNAWVRRGQDPASAPVRWAVLSNVVVADGDRGKGVGAALVSNFLAQASDASCDRACLVTLAGPEGAGGFYVKHGWTYRESRPGTDGRTLEHYEHQLT